MSSLRSLRIYQVDLFWCLLIIWLNHTTSFSSQSHCWIQSSGATSTLRRTTPAFLAITIIKQTESRWRIVIRFFPTPQKSYTKRHWVGQQCWPTKLQCLFEQNGRSGTSWCPTVFFSEKYPDTEWHRYHWKSWKEDFKKASKNFSKWYDHHDVIIDYENLKTRYF